MNSEKLNASVRYLNKVGESNLEKMKVDAPELAQRFEKLGALLSNENFAKQFAACADKEAAAKLFADHDFEITLEEAGDLMTQIKTMAQKLIDNDGELQEEDLELVSGGWSWIRFLEIVCFTCITVSGAALGTIICPGVGSAIGAVIGAAIGNAIAG